MINREYTTKIKRTHMQAFLLKNNIHTNLAEAFYSDILSQRNMYYYFLGRTISWNGDDSIPTIDDTFTEENDVRNNIIYMNRIGVNDISYVVKRNDWLSGTVYDRYDGDYSPTNPAYSGATHLKDAKFYVITDEMHVYKCIDNNSNGQSTIKPTGTDYETFMTGDGYKWKYMYSIQPNLQYKFLTETLMPVTRALNTRFYDNQGIESVTILNGGSGYEGDPITYATVSGDGTGAEIILSINPSTGSIANVIVTNQGQDYTTGTVNLINTDGKGEGIYGNLTAVLTPKFIGGKLVEVVVEDPGKNYSTDMQTNIVVDGTGTGAKLYPIVKNGEIVDVIIDNPGKGYSEVYLSIESVTGSGALLAVSTSIGDVSNIQADVELLSIPGTIDVVAVENEGSGYHYATCEIDGDGTGFEVTPIIYAGRIVRYDIQSIGTGYTWCTITVNGDGRNAKARPILSPNKGHGYDAITELFASSVSIYSSIKFDSTQSLLTNNDYRQFGILKNPEQYSSQALYRDKSSTTCDTLYIANTSSIAYDQKFYLQSNRKKKFVVVGNNGTNKILVQNFGGYDLSAGDVLVDENDINTQYTILDIQKPAIDKKSGELLFIDNRTSIFQTSEQFISLRTTIKF